MIMLAESLKVMHILILKCKLMVKHICQGINVLMCIISTAAMTLLAALLESTKSLQCNLCHFIFSLRLIQYKGTTEAQKSMGIQSQYQNGQTICYNMYIIIPLGEMCMDICTLTTKLLLCDQCFMVLALCKS